MLSKLSAADLFHEGKGLRVDCFEERNLENIDKKFEYRVKNIVEKGQIAHFQHFLLFQGSRWASQMAQMVPMAQELKKWHKKITFGAN